MDRSPNLEIEQSGTASSGQSHAEGRNRSFPTPGPVKIEPPDEAATVGSDAAVPERSTEQRPRYRAQDLSRSLRSSEIRAMSDIGKFRMVDVTDLGTFAYRGNGEQLTQDIQSLRARGLIEERTFYRAHRQLRRAVTLTEDGQRTLRSSGQVPDGQQLHSGFMRTRDIDHDADLYKVYQKEVEEIQKQGGKVTVVRLDCELKSSVGRDRFAANRLPKTQKLAWLKASAEQHGLSIKAGTVSVPDIQIEYETVEGTIAYANLELVSENYRGDAIRSKANAGFKVYVRTGDSNRVKRALNDSGSIERILSI